MGNSGNASPEFTILKRRSTPATTHSPSDRVTAKKGSNALGPRQLFPGLPIGPIFEFPDPEVDPIVSEASSDDALARALCLTRPETGSTSGPARDAASGEVPDEGC